VPAFQPTGDPKEGIMKRLYVLYDSQCGLCAELKRWAQWQPSYLELHFVAAGSAQAEQMFPGVCKPGKPEELIVISDEGGVYRDTRAWILCLYALENYREWAIRLSTPSLMPLARQAFHFLSRNRSRLSDWLGLDAEKKLAEVLRRQPVAACEVQKKDSKGAPANCPFCKGIVKLQDAVHCPECGSIHHLECWVANDYRCSIYGCSPAKLLEARAQ